MHSGKRIAIKRKAGAFAFLGVVDESEVLRERAEQSLAGDI